MYPMWFKNYAFRGMLTLNKFDKEKESFGRRTSSTVEPFVDLNREALALVYDILRKEIATDDLTEEQENLLSKGESFKKLYTHYYINNLPKDMDKETEGIWIKYNQGEDYYPLWESLQGKNTGWCTAGEETCKSQIEGGDFYVYYTKDEEGKYTNPRIAIRMDGTNKIGEVRGISSHQNLEENMTVIAEEKLKEFPDYERYKKKVSDMKYLTEIDHKTQKGIDLSKEELSFLYEIDNKIESFGYNKDPRIKEIQGKRNRKKDLAFLFDCKEEQVALTEEDLKNQHCIVAYGFDIGGKNLEYLENLKFMYGDIRLDYLTSIENLIFPESLTGNVSLHFLESADNLVLPKVMNGELFLNGLKSAKGLKLPKKIKGGLYLGGLTSTGSLKLPKEIQGNLGLGRLESAEGLVLPEKLNGNLILSGLESAEGLVLPKKLNGGLDLGGLISTEGLELPEELNGKLDLTRVEIAEGLILPKEINGNLDLGMLEITEGLILPQKMNGYLNLRRLTSAKDLVLPKKINGYLDFNSLTSTEGLMLPEKLNGILSLDSLKNTDTLTLPESYRNNTVYTSAQIVYIPDLEYFNREHKSVKK